MNPLILSIDQGTTSSRVLLFAREAGVVYAEQRELTQYFPADGWVEHDAEEIWQSVLGLTQRALAAAEGLGEVVALGITNQRETTLVWHRHTGRPVYRAIVWQDRRTAEQCAALRAQGLEEVVRDKTGLVLDAYFSATKLAWILQNVPQAEQMAQRGELAFGTVDSFLIWRLTAGARHVTDATNAARTMLFDLRQQQWDAALAASLNIPLGCLPEVLDCAAEFGTTSKAVLGQALPIRGVAGDQQAALIGQACFQPGMVKSTYGTGCFMIMHSGTTLLRSQHRLLSTLAYRLGGECCFALEGSIFIAGAAVQWLRDRLAAVRSAEETEALAAGLADNRGVYLVPAFTGLGAPHWNPTARGAVLGLTRDSGQAELVRAALESVCYQTFDVLQAMQADGGRINRLRVDGGMANNAWFCQFLADILATPIDRPANTETTALGVAYLAGLQSGVFDDLESIQSTWAAAHVYTPQMQTDARQQLLARWQRAVELVGQF